MMASLYLHIPFCEHKCIYCDFYSIAPHGSVGQDGSLVESFLGALDAEIELRSEDPLFQVPIDTVFFGGGTPSLLSASQLEKILVQLTSRFPLRPDPEITLETNPGTVDPAKLCAFRAAGVNRLSVGIQSFHDDDLRFLTRIHSSDEARKCVRYARKAGFENVSLDLIFALPNQSIDRWNSNLDQALELEPNHLSCYSLIVEPNTPLRRMIESKQVTPLGAEDDAAMYEFTIEKLTTAGYCQYEVSNFAKPGFKSLHNSTYWNHGHYLGLGPSAHSYWNRKRWWNIANIGTYIERLEVGLIPIAGEELLTKEQLMQETIFLGLRSEGVDVAGFHRTFARDLIVENRPTIDALVRDGLVQVDGEHLRLTAKGYPLCDEICASFR